MIPSLIPDRPDGRLKPRAKLHPTAEVHPTAVLEGEVTIGAHSTVGPHCYLVGPLVIGAHTEVRAGSIIGTSAEWVGHTSAGPIHIGDRNRIGELSVIQRGTERITQLGSGCFLMDHLHVGHDSILEDEVVTAPNVVLAGFSEVHRGARLGSGVVTHQFSVVGAYAMVGMGSAVTRDIQPFSLVKGNPARFARINSHCVEGLAFNEAELKLADGLFQSSHPLAQALLEHFHARSRRKKLLAK